MIFLIIKKKNCDHPKFFWANIIGQILATNLIVIYRLRLQLRSIFFLLDENFDKSIIVLLMSWKTKESTHDDLIDG